MDHSMTAVRRHSRPASLVALVAIVAGLASETRAQAGYALEVAAFSPDYPADAAATQRSFSEPRLNALGQVLFSSAWFRNYPQSRLHLGRPGNLAVVTTAGDPVPGVPGMNRKGGPSVGGAAAGVAVGFESANAGSETLFGSDTVAAPNNPLLFATGIFRGTAGALTLVAAAPFNEANPGAVPFTPVAGVPYTGTGRLQYSAEDSVTFRFNQPRPYKIADDGRAFFYANIDALEGTTVVPVVTDGLIEAATSGHRLVWHKGASAPDLPGNWVFESFDFTADGIGQKNGQIAVRTVVRPAGSNDPQTFRSALYQTSGARLLPFFSDGDALAAAPELSRTVARGEALRVDSNANALFEIDALNATAARTRTSLWKKVPAGVVRVVNLGEDVTVDGGTLRLEDEEVGANFTSTAIGGGRAAFVVRFTGPGFPLATLGLFREGPAGLHRLAWTGMTVPGTTLTLGIDLATTAPLLMNENGDVAFIASHSDQGVNRRALWVADRLGGIHRVVHVGQVISVAGMPRTISAFTLPNESPAPAPRSQVLNDAGQIVFSVRFTDGTQALLRGSPAGYADPPLLGQDFHFTGLKGDNWHAKGGTPPTNWESSRREARVDAPGDVEVDSAQVFVAAGRSVLLEARPAFIGSIDAAGEVRLRQHLRVSQASTLTSLRAESPAAALTLGAATVISGITDWAAGNVTLSNATLRNTGTFSAGSGTVAGSGADGRFENVRRLIKAPTSTFSLNVPVHFVEVPDPNGGDAVEIAGSGTLRLLGGGRFASPSGRTSFAFRSPTASLEMAGAFTLENSTLELDGPGAVSLGNAASDVILQCTAASRIVLFHRPQVTLHRGSMVGSAGFLLNEGTFVWRGGRIALGTPASPDSIGFDNAESFEIEAGAAVRSLEGRFTNHGTLRQRAPFELRGYLLNERGTWQFHRSALVSDPSGQGLCDNNGSLIVPAEDVGTVDFHPELRVSPFGSLTVQGGPTAVNTLHLRGRVANLDSGRLREGVWKVLERGVLRFPAEVSEISARTFFTLDGGNAPEFRLRRNLGDVRISNVTYRAPAAVENQGNLLVGAKADVTIPANLDSAGSLQCSAEGTLRIGGVLIQRLSYLINDGTIHVDGGDIRCEASRISGAGRYVMPQGTFVFKDGVLQAGNSPGAIAIEGALALEGATRTEIELAGTQPAQHDRIVASRSVTLGGELLVTLLDNFRPAAGQSFVVIEGASLSGAFSNAVSGQRITTTDGTGSLAVFYGAGSPHGANRVVLADWLPSPAGAPLILAQPRGSLLTAGDGVALSVAPGGNGPFTFQWQRNGVNIPGATTASYNLPSAQLHDAGVYSVIVANALGTVRSSIVALDIDPPRGSDARLVNLSTRALTEPGDRTLIPGFVISGTASKRLLIRGIGPTLATFGISGSLANPRVQLYRGGDLLATNDDWGVAQGGVTRDLLAATATAVGAFALPDGSRDAALLTDLPPGAYTVQAAGVPEGSGVAIVEIYDTDRTTSGARLANLSTRGFVGAGDNIMIPGIVLTGGGAQTFLIRAIGPALAQFGVSGVLNDPVLTIVQSGQPLLTNDDWAADAATAGITAATAAGVGAFPLPAGSRDAALAVSLRPGNYTVLVSGKNDATGVALVEIYLVP